MGLVEGKTLRHCDECSKYTDCNIVGLRSLSSSLSVGRYIFYICNECLQTMADIGGVSNENIVKTLKDSVSE